MDTELLKDPECLEILNALSLTEWSALAEEIASETKISHSKLREMLDKMERGGLISQTEDLVELTSDCLDEMVNQDPSLRKFLKKGIY